MDDILVALRRDRAVRALLPLFFLSGATALVYQTLWARHLQLVFGTSTFAIATVLASFMAGLAIGGFVMARYADRVVRPLAAYGWLEVAIGVYALLFPLLVGLLSPVYLAAWRLLEPPPLLFGLIQFALVGSALLVPTAMMGATLPLLARFATERLGAAGERVGTLYAVNTAGAVFGTWACGFVLLPQVGLTWTTFIASAANFLLGGAAVAISAWAQGAERPAVEADLPPDRVHPALGVVAAASAMAGFAALVYEVAFTRVLVLMIGASVYAFSVMLLAFLTGIALGGKLGGRLSDRLLARKGPAAVLRLLAVLQVGVGVTAFALLFIFPELPFWYVWLFDALGAGSRPNLVWGVSLFIAGVVMTPPAVLMGASFPVAVRAVLGDTERLGGPVGLIYGWNTLGAVFGAALAGFLFLPMLGVQRTIVLAVLVNLASAVWLLARGGLADVEARRRPLSLGAVAVALPLAGLLVYPSWNPLLMTAGMYQYVTRVQDTSRAGVRSYAVDRFELLFYEEGLSSVVTVARNVRTGSMWLANNGKIEASTRVDMPTQVLCAILPFQYAEDPDDVLVIGLASGITAGSATQVQAMHRLEVVELEPAILRAARYFDDYNHRVLDDPRTRMVINDGRNHVLLAPQGSFDVVISEPSNPWISGVSNLFTREFFEVGSTRLKPGGVWSQWVQLYGMGEADLRSLLATFADVYPYVLVYATIEDADLVLLGSHKPLRPHLDVPAALHTREPLVAEELGRVEMHDPMDLLSTLLMDREGILAMAGNAVRNTDDNMRIEYSAPLHLHRRTAAANVRQLVRHARVPVEAVDHDPVLLVDLARAYLRRGDVDRSLRAAAHALEVLLRDHEDPRVVELAAELPGRIQDLERVAALTRMAGLVGQVRAGEPPEGFLVAWESWSDELATWFRGEDAAAEP